MIPYGRQMIDDDDVAAVVAVLKSDFLTQGPKIGEFERALGDYCGCKYAVAFNSGTSALHGAYFSAGLSSNDEFISSPITFAATTNAGMYLGAKPVFADVEKDTGNMDIGAIKDGMNEKTKLIVPVHYAGHSVNLEKLSEIARSKDLIIVEDACHALGASYNGEKIGSCEYSDMTVLSFHPVKHITTGEGGAVLTNNEAYYKKLLMFRTHGITKDELDNKSPGSWYYEMQLLGYNYRMTDIQAALGTSQLAKLDMFVDRRRNIVDEYNKAFLGNQYFDIPVEKSYAQSSWHLYPIRLKDKYISRKNEVVIAMKEVGLGVQVHYIPVYLHPYYQNLGYKKGLCPIAEEFYQQEISLPIFPSLSDDEVGLVISRVFEAFERVPL